MMLSEELYNRFAELIRARAGLHYPEQRRADLAQGLKRAAQHLGVDDLAQLFDLVERYPAAWNELMDELTIGETYFFRNAAQFAALRELILPDLIQRRALVRYLRFWSAGCATGEEPYSLAIALREALPIDPPWQVSILATDVNRRFLARAREACYGNWSFRDTPEDVRDRYFIPDNGRWRLRPEIRADVTFAYLNLAEPVYPSPQSGIIAFDVIFCRNVMIYFDEATTRQVVQRLYDALVPGGWLVVGHAEPNIELYRQFETHNAPGTVLYRKPLNAPPFIVAQSAPSPALAIVAQQPAPVLATPPISSVARQPEPRPVSATVSSPAEQLQAARAAADRGDWSAAAALVQALRTAHPLFAPAYYLQAQIAEHHGQLEAALADYRRSVYLDPQFALGLIGMAGIYARTDHPAAARRSLRQARDLLAQRADSEVVDSVTGGTVAELRAYIDLLLQKLKG